MAADERATSHKGRRPNTKTAKNTKLAFVSFESFVLAHFPQRTPAVRASPDEPQAARQGARTHQGRKPHKYQPTGSRPQADGPQDWRGNKFE